MERFASGTLWILKEYNQMNNKQRYNRSIYIDAMMWSYGMTKTEAKEQVKTAINNGLYGILNAIADGYYHQCKLAFNCD